MDAQLDRRLHFPFSLFFPMGFEQKGDLAGVMIPDYDHMGLIKFGSVDTGIVASLMVASWSG